MTKHQKILLIFAALFGALSVTMAAIGTHALHAKLMNYGLLETYAKAVNYMMYSALALPVTVVLLHCIPTVRWWLVGYTWVLATLLFSGSLFLFTVAEMGNAVRFTPWGGSLWIIGWLLLGVLALFAPSKQ